MKFRVRFALPLLVLGALPAGADEITLTSLEGDTVIRGIFAGYAAETYVVRIAAQEIAVPAALVTCEGVDCAQNGPLVVPALAAPQN